MSSDLQTVAPSVISVRSDWDVIAARMAARDFARKMGFNTIDQARIATVASELTRSIIRAGNEGLLTIGQIHADQREGVELVFGDLTSDLHSDEPLTVGIVADSLFEASIVYARRLVDEVRLLTQSAERSIIICRKWLR